MTNSITDALTKIIDHSLPSFKNTLFRFPMYGDANILGNHYEVCISSDAYGVPDGSSVINIRITRPTWHVRFKMNANISKQYGHIQIIDDGTGRSICDIQEHGYIDDMRKDMSLVLLT